MNQTQKVVFSLTRPVISQFKKLVPARKRSEVIEDLIVNYIAQTKEQAAWEATHVLRKAYSSSNDPVKLSAVEWLRRDRSNH